MIYWQNHVEAFVKNDQKALEEMWDFEYELEVIRHKAFFADGNKYKSKQGAIDALNKMLADRRSKGKIASGVELESLYKEIAEALDIKCKNKGCGKPILARSRLWMREAECNECHNKHEIERSRHEEQANRIRSKEEYEKHPIIKYVNHIRQKSAPHEEAATDWKYSSMPDDNDIIRRVKWDIERGKKDFERHASYVTRKDFEEATKIYVQTGRLTKAEVERKYHELRNRKKLRSLELVTEKRDSDHKYHNTPYHKFQDDVRRIGCQCDTEKFRLTGEICKTCKLVLKAHEYMLTLFRDASWGKTV